MALFYKIAWCAKLQNQVQVLKRPADELIQFMSPEPMEQELIALQAELYELKKSIYTTSKNDYSMFSSVGQSAAYQQVCDLLK